jgi:transposase-like protein
MAKIHQRELSEQVKLGKECLRLRGLGVSLSQLAQRFSVSQNSLQKWINHYRQSLKS